MIYPVKEDSQDEEKWAGPEQEGGAEPCTAPWPFPPTLTHHLANSWGRRHLDAGTKGEVLQAAKSAAPWAS